MAVDYATKKILEQMAARGGKALHEGTLEDARALVALTSKLAGPAPKMGSVEDHTVTSSDGAAVTVRVIVPPQPAQGVLVYLHGGGFVVGCIDEYDTLARKLAERTACAVVLVEYRLAPEFRYPLAVADSYAALVWASARRAELTGLAENEHVPLIVAGDSAGGNLAAVLTHWARDRNGPAIDLQVLVYPVTDADLDRPSYLDPENQLALTRESVAWCWDHYVPDAGRRFEPDVSPLRASSFAGLPRAVVLTAEHDVLRDEGEAYAEKLREAGVPVDLKRHAGQMHGFFSLLMLPGSERGYQQVVRAVRSCIVRKAKARTGQPV